ncbi:Gfo/Idh/MocA family protein [Agromyces bracchium]|uniref:Gfo/Idh/MocA family oxidoreductase n=1 Tax=Agromyces bracchium TaxID=88376 RepID=A0A6I3MBL9_9MICO|nr:Gfo/Idh/MocA family oxidoreductase [Agromyces bracchium]MTH70411.1 gfo/Idh/MocA family oxidoreductase [Agromyces bracchium]
MSDTVNESGALGWAIIGTGWMTRTHMVRAINKASDSRVVAVLSSSQQRAEEFANEHDIPNAYSSLDDLLADPTVDVVFVSSTNELHKPQALAAAAAGKHVLCEKPLSTNIQDGLDIVEACREAGVVLGTNHYRRLKTTIQTVRRLIAEGAIGVPILARATSTGWLSEEQQTWRLTSVEAGGGVVLDIGVHDADLLRYLLDDEVESVSAVTGHSGLLKGELEDYAVTTLRFRNGTIATSTVSFCTPGSIGAIEVMGSEGTIFARDLLADKLGGEIYVRRGGLDLEMVHIGAEEEHYAEAVRQFNEAVRGNGEPAVTGEDGVLSLAVAIAALRSAERGSMVRLSEVLPENSLVA